MAAKETNLEKLKALQLTLDKIEKNFGKGSIMKLGDNQVENIPVISSGSISLDKALGVGGYPKGRVIEIYGPVKQHWPYTPSQKPRNKAVSQPS